LTENVNPGNFGPVHFEKIGDFVLITIDRPDKLNALNEGAWEGLRLSLQAAESDDGIRSVFITGKGRAFCAGDDIEMMSRWKGESDARAWMDSYARPLVDVMRSYPKPIIALVNGLAFGGGCEITMLADIVVASEDAIFSLPEVRIGAMPPIGSTYGLALLNGRIARYLLTGVQIPAERAMDLGLVDLIVPRNMLQEEMVKLAGEISRCAPLSVKEIKRSINGVRNTMANLARNAEDSLTGLVSTSDFREGQAAFLEKRNPNWKGK
jgi:enoyl-CoA hydratase/carnithine racemase